MKRVMIGMGMAIISIATYAQKPVIDTSVYGKWPAVPGICKLSPHGAWLAYDKYDFGGYHTVIRSIRNTWEKELGGKYEVFFADNSQLAIWKNGAQRLCIFNLRAGHEENISMVNSFKVVQNEKAEWLLYQLSHPNKELILRNLSNGSQKVYLNVADYQLLPNGRKVLIQQQSGDGIISINLLDPVKNKAFAIWKGKSLDKFVFAANGTSLAFTGAKSLSDMKTIWYYHEGDKEAQMLNWRDIKHRSYDGLVGFDYTGQRLFFKLKDSLIVQKPNPNLADVDIYSYKDAELHSAQKETVYTYCYNFPDRRLVELCGKNERLLDFSHVATNKTNYLLVAKNEGGDVRGEWNWNPSALTSICLVSTADGTQEYLCRDQPQAVAYQLSPDNRYVIYYDTKSSDYCCYDVASGITKDITKSASADWITDGVEEDWPDSVYEVSPSYRWAANDEAVFINSKNCIYQADPSGRKPAIKLANGEKGNLKFSFAELEDNSQTPIDLKKPLLLKVLDRETGDEGFCRVMPGRTNNPELAGMLPMHADRLEKAQDADVYILTLESTTSAPNWYLTTDFKNYQQLTDIHPEKAYNWLTSDLVHFQTTDGKTTQGILFKPENFDSKKKYPVIFEYYERGIVSLHGFPSPDPRSSDGGARIDIATYVSNGYLVFTPDIYYRVGHPGQSACSTILGAANYLSQFPWADTAHMGLMGHSFGGFETNYVITHSHRFAAAVSMSGMSDFISAYGSIIGGGSRQHQYELYRDRIGATLWQRPDLYIENSPVLKVDQVSTPVLLMANKKDDDVPYEQGFEFFTALRRLQKKAWLLQYDNGGHQVFEQPDAKDVTLRMRQFFDYYLKGKTPPKWMTTGIPANEKQIDSGFEADATGQLP